MKNRNILKSNLRSIDRVLKGYDQGEKKRDDLLKVYNKAIKQIPDHYNKNFNDKRVYPTTIAAASKRLVKHVKTRDAKLLKINPKGYMKMLHQAHKDGNWTLFDYKHNQPLDSSPDKCRNIIFNYRTGLFEDLSALREQENDDNLEM